MWAAVVILTALYLGAIALNGVVARILSRLWPE